MVLLQKLFVAVAVSALLPVAGIAQESGDDARPAKVVVVESSDPVFQRRYPGIVKPSQQVELSFRVSGRVIELPVRASTRVTEGDVIARLDPRDFKTKIAQLVSQLDQANAQLRQLRAGARNEEIAAMEAAVEAVQAQVDQARDQATRSRTLFAKELVAAVAVEQDETNLRVAEAELRTKLEELAIGRAGGSLEEVEAAEAAIRGLDTQIQTAKDNLEDATLRAPFDGIIARRYIENFTNIQAGSDIVLLQKLSVVNLEFDLPGPDVNVFASAETVTTEVSFNLTPGQVFPAELVEFSTQADAATQTYRGQVAVTLPEGLRVLPGMVGSVIATTDTENGAVIQVPLTALGANADGSSFVWIVDMATNVVTKRTIAVGEVTGADIQVLDGLLAGDTVVSAGVTRLQDGMTIRPITQIGG